MDATLLLLALCLTFFGPHFDPDGILGNSRVCKPLRDIVHSRARQLAGELPGAFTVGGTSKVEGLRFLATTDDFTYRQKGNPRGAMNN